MEVRITEIEEIKMMHRMILLSSVFRSSKGLSKDVEKTKDRKEEGPCTSYSHQEGEIEHEKHLEL